MSDALKAQLRAQIAAIEAGGALTAVVSGSARGSGVRAKGYPGGVFEKREEFIDTEDSVRNSHDCGDGLSLEDDRDDEASQVDEQQRAFRKIERIAALREQASAALRTRLMRDGFSAQATDIAVERACACGLVDDARYADVLVRSRLSQGRGAQGIEAELSRLDIDISIVQGWPEDFAIDHESEVQRALVLLDRKPPRAKNQREAAYRRLAQKGFGASVASTAARCWVESQLD